MKWDDLLDQARKLRADLDTPNVIRLLRQESGEWTHWHWAVCILRIRKREGSKKETHFSLMPLRESQPTAQVFASTKEAGQLMHKVKENFEFLKHQSPARLQKWLEEEQICARSAGRAIQKNPREALQ